ncbi:MAG: hypothetical protein HF967_09765 [Methanosarcinales archaeon]|nr:hypothetical protein [Methanosarcinales archaeon]
MTKFKLTPYSIRIKKKKSDSYLNINEIPTDNGNINLLEIFNILCDKYNTEVYEIVDRQKTFCIENVSFDKNKQCISGIIKSGEYGIETDYYNVEQKKRISSARKKEDSEEMPFFFLFHSPQHIKNTNLCFLILGKFKQFGVKTVLEKVIQEMVEKENSELLMEIYPLISNELMDMLDSSRIMELKFIKKKVPKDIANKNLIKNYEDVKEVRSFIVKRNKEIIFNIKENILKILKDIEYPYYEFQNEKYDDVKIVVKKEDNAHTISLEDLPKFREVMPLNPNDIIIGENGFPTKNSLLEKAKEYMNIILEKYDENLLH